jgi:ribosomal protein L12E/L44/L45/RPP1/RPP2
MVKHTTTTSAYMFKYDILCEQLNGIDFERTVNATEEKTEPAASAAPAEQTKSKEPEIEGIDPNDDPFK